MILKIHHLNCGTLCPLCKRLINDRNGEWREPGKLVCHCLLIETTKGLVLVDSGIGTRDVIAARKRLGRAFLSVFKPRLEMKETAIYQIRELGYDPKDVLHIIPTHLDLDHAGGLVDFPNAQIHVYRPELQQILEPTWRDRFRFRLAQFEHQPNWKVHEQVSAPWFGFQAIRPIDELSADILIIPLIGHTKGHVGVAIRQESQWLMHCGDAYYHHSQLTESPQMPVGLKFFEKNVATLGRHRVENLEKLKRLALEHSDKVEMFCAHDPWELERYQA